MTFPDDGGRETDADEDGDEEVVKAYSKKSYQMQTPFLHPHTTRTLNSDTNKKPGQHPQNLFGSSVPTHGLTPRNTEGYKLLVLRH